MCVHKAMSYNWFSLHRLNTTAKTSAITCPFQVPVTDYDKGRSNIMLQLNAVLLTGYRWRHFPYPLQMNQSALHLLRTSTKHTIGLMRRKWVVFRMTQRTIFNCRVLVGKSSGNNLLPHFVSSEHHPVYNRPREPTRQQG